jgi:hypothetical protein
MPLGIWPGKPLSKMASALIFTSWSDDGFQGGHIGIKRLSAWPSQR